MSTKIFVNMAEEAEAVVTDYAVSGDPIVDPTLSLDDITVYFSNARLLKESYAVLKCFGCKTTL